MKLELLKNKKVLVLGLSREGESSFRFLRKQFPGQIIGLADKSILKELPSSMRAIIKKDKKMNPVRSKRPKAYAASLMRTSNGVKLYLGKNYLRAIKDYDVVIKTPGISKKLLLPHITSQKITSQTEIFLEKYRKQTIGITGTKGKGTTASLIYKILLDNGLKAQLIGNIGKPALDYWKKNRTNEIFIFEISSHQLENLKISPHIAVFLNIYSDHLDYFKNLKQYFNAKANITKWQTSNDYFIFNQGFLKIKKLAQKSKAKKIAFEAKREGDYFLCNTMAAQAVACLSNITAQQAKKSIKTWKTFEHRLEFVGRFKGINFYNDSASTIPEATIAALNSLKNVETLILGGSEKSSNFESLAKIIIDKKIKTVILFPKEGKRIWQEISKQAKQIKGNLPQHFFVNKMKQAVKLCFQQTSKNSICLLSPACASFTTFKNYQDRGEQFKKYIKQAAKK